MQGLFVMSIARTRGARVALILGLMGTLVVAGPVAATVPSNDQITSPRIISAGALNGVLAATNVGATFGGEPAPTCPLNGATVGASIWWRYRQVMAVNVNLNTVGSSFDTVLAVYKSTSNGLTQVACSDDYNGTPQSAVAFTAAANAVYYIQISGYQGLTGNVQFAYSFNAVNDAFAKAQQISPGFSAAFNSAFTANGRQANEPAGCDNVGHTLWYRFKASATRKVSFDTFESDFDSQVTVYRGTSLGHLTPVTCADDTDEQNGDASVFWTAKANTTYYIQVGGYNNAFGPLKVNFVRLP